MNDLWAWLRGFFIENYIESPLQTFMISLFITVVCKGFNYGLSGINLNADEVMKIANQVFYYLAIPAEISTIISFIGLIYKTFKRVIQTLINFIKNLFS